MSFEPVVNEIIALLHKAMKDEYERGKSDAIAAILSAAKGVGAADRSINLSQDAVDDSTKHSAVESMTPTRPRMRAPRGSVKTVILRAMSRQADNGATVRDILAERQSTDELMIVDSSIRGELRRGLKLGEYIERDERWYQQGT